MPHHPTRIEAQSLTRRDLLRRGGMGFGLLGLAGVLQTEGLLGPPARAATDVSPLAPKRPHFPARARRVVHLFMNGGPSHVDTFDPKPALEQYHGKPLPNPNLRTERKTAGAMRSPFSFQRYGQSGIEVSELFARTAECIDDICVIRSMVAEVPNHEPSLMLMNCGDARLPRPSMGAWVTYGLGSESQDLPGFIAMCPGGYPIVATQNWRSAFLPGAYQGTYIDTQHTDIPKLIENIRNNGQTPAEQRRQMDLVRRLNELHLEQRRPLTPTPLPPGERGEVALPPGERGEVALPSPLRGRRVGGEGDAQLEARIQSFELAYRMQAEAADAFDINREPAFIRDMYGSGTHGRQLLIARRLLERGVRFVQVWSGGGQPWDNHEKLETEHRKLAQTWDQPLAAFLKDLKQRGLLDSTLVLWGGEFGRTPVAELPQLSGRDHNHYGFSVWLAGGGVKGGQVIGATDEFGFAALEPKVHVHDLHATMLHLLGFDHEKLTYRYAGRDFRLTDVHGRVVKEVLA